jgi:hypothetical protein
MVSAFMIYLHTEFHVDSSNYKTQIKLNVRSAAMFFF